MTTRTHTPLVTGLWIGDTLPPIAELCIRSYLANGIQFQLFTYRESDYPNLPAGTLMRDAEDIIPGAYIYRHDNGSMSPFSDWFRWAWLYREGGIWTDMDMVCLTPNIPQWSPYYVREDQSYIAQGVVMFPERHMITRWLRDLGRDPSAVMPWDTPEEIAAKVKFAQDVPNIHARRKSCAWGVAGPRAFTRALIHYDMAYHAAPADSIYPLPYTAWHQYYDGTRKLTSINTRHTWALHLWGEMLRRDPSALDNLHPDSIIATLMARYGMGGTSQL